MPAARVGSGSRGRRWGLTMDPADDLYLLPTPPDDPDPWACIALAFAFLICGAGAYLALWLFDHSNGH